MPTKKIPYLNRFTGGVLVVTKQHAKKLSEDWQKIEFTVNNKGDQVMRLQFNDATVDILENSDSKGVEDGNRSTS